MSAPLQFCEQCDLNVFSPLFSSLEWEAQVDWRRILQISSEHLRRDPSPVCHAWSWCSWTTFSRLGEDAGYWQAPLPAIRELLDDYVDDGGTWGQPFRYSDLAHIIVPRRFGWEGSQDSGWEGGYHEQDIIGLSAYLRAEQLDHRLSEPIGGKLPTGHPLFDIIDEAYRVFACPKPTSTGVCEGCCMNAKIEADFFKPPIRQLPLEYVNDWFNAAVHRDGLPKDIWTYLLPRVIEILAAGERPSNVAIEVSLKRFDTGNPDNWSKREWQVIDRFQKQFLQYQIAQLDRESSDFDGLICMFRLAEWSLDDLCAQVAGAPDELLAHRLWLDWCSWAEPHCGSIWVTTFWEAPDDTIVHNFYTSQTLLHKMEALALADDVDPEIARKASAVASLMEFEAANRSR